MPQHLFNRLCYLIYSFQSLLEHRTPWSKLDQTVEVLITRTQPYGTASLGCDPDTFQSSEAKPGILPDTRLPGPPAMEWKSSGLSDEYDVCLALRAGLGGASKTANVFDEGMGSGSAE